MDTIAFKVWRTYYRCELRGTEPAVCNSTKHHGLDFVILAENLRF